MTKIQKKLIFLNQYLEIGGGLQPNFDTSRICFNRHEQRFEIEVGCER